MRYYAGLDVSLNTTFITLIDEEREIVFEEEVQTDPKIIAFSLKKSGFLVEKAAIESSSLSHWLTQELIKENIPVICIDARKMAKVLSININKTDKNDARLIAEALRCNFYSEVHKKSKEHAEMQVLMGSRRSIIEVATKLKNTIRGHLKIYGIRIGTANHNKFIMMVADVLKDKPSFVQDAIAGSLECFRTTLVEIKKMERAIEELAKKDEKCAAVNYHSGSRSDHSLHIY